MQEAELIHKAMLGDSTALTQLVELHYEHIYAFCCRRVGNTALGADLCQDTFVKMVENLPRYRESGRFQSWLFTIAANLCRDAFRKNRPQSTLEDWAPDAKAERFVQHTENSDLLQAALAKLPDAQREAIVLRYYHGFATRDIAAILHLPNATVKTRLFRGLKKMQSILGEAYQLEQ